MVINTVLLFNFIILLTPLKTLDSTPVKIDPKWDQDEYDSIF